MGQDDKIHNPVEQYMKYIMDLDKPDKPLETVTEPAKHLEVKGIGRELSASGGNRYYAVKIADAIKQSVNIKMNPKEDRQAQAENSSETPAFDVGRHPVGLIFIGLSVVVGYAAVFSLVSFFLPGFAGLIGVELSIVGRIVGLSMLTMVLFGMVFLFIGVKNYLLGRFILKDSNIVYVFQSGLTGKKAVELPMSDIEDIIVQKTGILSSLFNYGTIIIETPQGQNNFVFKYAPDPDVRVKAIHDSRLEYLANRGITGL